MERSVSPWWDLLVLPVGLAALGWPVAKRPAWFTPELRTTVPAGLALIMQALFAIGVFHEEKDPPSRFSPPCSVSS